MKEIPMLFSTPMVQAILAGRKTMTRRIVNMDDLIEFPDKFRSVGDSREWDVPRPAIKYDDRIWFAWEPRNSNAQTWIERCRWKPGDIIWVRETCCAHETPEGLDGVLYKADGGFIEIENSQAAADKWMDLRHYGKKQYREVPSIHMPKWASRIWLENTGIRVERLQDITEEDAIAEGIEHSMSGDGRIVWKHYTKDKWGPSPVHSYETLWRKINGEESWQLNPWVWVVSFKVLSTTGKK